MAGRLDAKRVLITGTAGGQGLEAFRLFAREGARVEGCDVKPGLAEAAADELRAEGLDATGTTTDLRDPAEAARWVDDAAARLGGLDVVYNNAGGGKFGPVDQLALDDWDACLLTELSTVFYVTRAAWSHLKVGGGCFINIASVAGLEGHAQFPSVAHAAAKGGVLAFTRQVAAEGAAFAIRANAICPGYIETPATANLPAEVRTTLISHNFVPRAGRPADIAHCALYLASDEAEWVTGAHFVIDGGSTAGTT